jgi:hypothetical protein
VVAIDTREARELDLGQARLGTAEAALARPITETCEEC